jgi:hypothetical protein
MHKKNTHAVALGRLGGRKGGQSTSNIKREAARKNGTRGGRIPIRRNNVIDALRSARHKPSRELDALAEAMVTDPKSVVRSMATSGDFDHLGNQASDEVARCFGFGSFDAIGLHMEAAPLETIIFSASERTKNTKERRRLLALLAPVSGLPAMQARLNRLKKEASKYLGRGSQRKRDRR